MWVCMAFIWVRGTHLVVFVLKEAGQRLHAGLQG